MFAKEEILHHPVNGYEEQTWDGFSWPAFFFGLFWMLAKGLYGHFLIMLLIIAATYGLAAPLVWITYGFTGNEAHKISLLRKGYLTTAQWESRSAPSLTVSNSSQAITTNQQRDVVTQLRELADLHDRGVLTDDEFSKQKAKILDAC